MKAGGRERFFLWTILAVCMALVLLLAGYYFLIFPRSVPRGYEAPPQSSQQVLSASGAGKLREAAQESPARQSPVCSAERGGLVQNGKTQFGEPVKKILRFLFRDGKGTPGALPLAAEKVPGIAGKQMKTVGSLDCLLSRANRLPWRSCVGSTQRNCGSRIL